MAISTLVLGKIPQNLTTSREWFNNAMALSLTESRECHLVICCAFQITLRSFRAPWQYKN